MIILICAPSRLWLLVSMIAISLLHTALDAFQHGSKFPFLIRPWLPFSMAAISFPDTALVDAAQLQAPSPHNGLIAFQPGCILPFLIGFWLPCQHALLFTQALREHCSLSGHDPTKSPKPSKQKQSLAPVQPAVPLELTVQPIPDQVEIERCSDLDQHVLPLMLSAFICRR